MSRTWKDLQSVGDQRMARLEKQYREAIAKEKARGEVLLALTTGKLKARQVKGNEYVGKAGSMERAIRFDLEQLISLRAESLARS